MKKETVLISGASAGIGRELSKWFVKDGKDLVILARREEKLLQFKNELEEIYNTQVHIVTKDLSQPNSAQEVFDEIEGLGLQIDYLINNAGFGHLGKFSETDLSLHQRMMQLNMVSLTELTYLFLPGMIERNRG